MRGKKSVGKGVIAGRKRRRQKIYRKQRGWGFPIGLLASAAAPFLGERAKPILKKFSVVEGDEETKNCTLMTSCPIKHYLAKQYNVWC